MRDFPLDQHTMFADLVDRCLTAAPAGSVYRRKRAGIEYLYAKLDACIHRKDIYLGKAGDEHAERRAKDIGDARDQARARQSTVRLLRAAGFTAPDAHAGKLLKAIADAGVFDRGAVLVGTIAYLILQPVVGVRLPAATLMTRDIDVATGSLKLGAATDTPMIDILAQVDTSYVSVPTLEAAGWPWRFRNADGYLVDLLTPARTRTDSESVPLPAFGAGAAPLQYLKWLITSPIQTVALHGAGIVVSVPQPARFAVHKLILAQKRNASQQAKRRKDLLQAAALMDALRNHNPFALEDALSEARSQGKKGWSDLIDRSLTEIENR